MAPAEGLPPPVPADTHPKPQPPRSLPALLLMILRGMAANIRGMVASTVKGMIIGFVFVLAISTFLQVTRLRQEDLAASVIASSGPGSSANALLFWFLFTAILAFFWSQVTSRGVRPTLEKSASLPRWVWSSATETGIAALPLAMAGLAAALMVRLLLLTPATGIQFLILVFGILFSQQESLAVLALSLGWSDLIRLVRKTGPVIPAPGFPVMGMLGAFCGFLAAIFFPDNLYLLTLLVLLLVAASVVVWYWRRTAPRAPAQATDPGGRRP